MWRTQTILFLTQVLLYSVAQSQVLDRNCFGADQPELSDTFLASPVDKEAQSQVYFGERAFSVNLIKALFDKYQDNKIEKNIFISPSSIFHTLTLAYFGAKGDTASQLSEGLGFGNLTKSDVLKAYMFDRAHQAVRERVPGLGYEFQHANKLYFDKTLQLNHCLQLALSDQIETVDFTENPEAARSGMNEWVENMTKGNIKEMIPSGMVDTSTRASIVNAAYFKGQWLSQFKEKDTKVGNFYVTRNEIRLVKFMNQKGSFNYYSSEELQAHIVELPYEGDDMSMIIILPPFLDDALQQTVKKLTPDTLQAVMAEVKSGFFKMEKLNVQIPKFKLSDDLELTEPLSKLNISRLFGAGGDITGFLDESTPAEKAKEVGLNSAIHKSTIEVNEEGSEAAASTALLGFRSARPLFHTEFKADHPFLFLIYDKQVDTILFFGVYQYPVAKSP